MPAAAAGPLCGLPCFFFLLICFFICLSHHKKKKQMVCLSATFPFPSFLPVRFGSCSECLFVCLFVFSLPCSAFFLVFLSFFLFCLLVVHVHRAGVFYFVSLLSLKCVWVADVSRTRYVCTLCFSHPGRCGWHGFALSVNRLASAAVQ